MKVVPQENVEAYILSTKDGKDFQVNKNTFEQTYKRRTAKPDGTLDASEAKYTVKKKLTAKQLLTKTK